MRTLRRHWPILVLLLVPLLAIGKAVFTSETIGAYDQIAQMAPFGQPKPDQPFDVLQADSVLQFYPWRSMVFEAWSKGQMPFWNPYQLCGTPLMANSQSGALYPPHIVMGVLRVPTGAAIDLLAWFHLFVAGWGVYACVRRFGGTEVGGLVGGASFALSSFMVSWTALPSVVSTCAWIPWVFWGIAGLLSVPSHSPSLDGNGTANGEGEGTIEVQSSVEGEGARRPMFILALSTAMMFLAGHLQFSAYGLIGAFVLGAVLLIQGVLVKQKSVWKGALLAATAVAAGGLLAMPQLKPVLEYSQFSHRKVDRPTEEGYKAYLGLALKPEESLGRVFNAAAQGDPRVPLDIGLEDQKVGSYLPATTRPGANFAESAIGPGAIVFAFALCAFGRNVVRGKWALGILAILAFSMACGGFGNRFLYFYVPGWASTGSPGRIGVLFVLALCLLAGIGTSNLRSLKFESGIGVAVATFLAGVAAAVVGGVQLPPDTPDSSPIEIAASFMWFDHLRVVGAAAFVAIVAVLAGRSASSKWSSAAFFGIALASTGFWIGAAPTSQTSRIEADAPSGTERHAFENERWAFVVAAPAVMPPNTASILRTYDVAGYDSLLHRDTVALLHEIDGRDSAPEANGNMMFVKPGASIEKLGDAGVSKLHRRNPQTGSLEQIDVPTKGRAYTERAPAVIRDDGYDRQTVFAAGPGTLVVKDRNMPGWSATVDGKSVPIQGDRWREVTLEGPEGGHKVEFRYEPPGFKQGLGLAAVGALLLAGAGWLGGKSKIVREKTENPL